MITLDYDLDFPFYRCTECGHFLCHLDVLKAMKTGELCSCGANEVAPTDATWIDHFKLPFWRMLLAVLRGQVKWQQN